MPRGGGRVAVVGGSFDRLHAGHRALLARAFAAAPRVGIGVTTSAYLARHPKPQAERIQSYAVRRRTLERFLRQHYPPHRWWIVPLADAWGRSVEPGVDLLVASSETAISAGAVNRERGRRGLPPLQLVLVDLVRADDGLPISSRRIRAGFIDPDGRRLGPLQVDAIGFRAADLTPFLAAFKSVLPTVRLRVARHPLPPRRRRGNQLPARARALRLVSRPKDRAEYSVAIVRAEPSSASRPSGRSWVAVSSSTGSHARRVGQDTPSALTRTIAAALRAISRG